MVDHRLQLQVHGPIQPTGRAAQMLLHAVPVLEETLKVMTHLVRARFELWLQRRIPR